MFIAKATIAFLFAAGLGAASVSFTGDRTPVAQASAPAWQFEVVEAVGWDGGPGAPMDL